MSSRRKLKKQINQSMELLYTDCIFYKVFVIDADKEAADKLLATIVEAHEGLIKRVSVNEGREAKGRVKTYYKKLKADAQEHIDGIGKKIMALG